MEFYVDIADIEKIKAVNERYPIDGFTTNPVILTRSARDPKALFRDYKAYIAETNQILFTQVTAHTAEGMVSQALKLSAFFGDNLVIKLPAVREGYKAIKLCKSHGLKVCVTMVHSVMQSVLAAQAGADGVRCVEQMLRCLEFAHSPCKILGASFRTVDQIEKLAVAGCHAVTLTPEMFDMLIAHPSTDMSVESFDRTWNGKFPGREITDFLPE